MLVIVAIAVGAILLLQWVGGIPEASVGGPLTIAAVYLLATLAVAIHEAWTNKRGIIGWIVTLVVSFVGAFIAAQIGGMAMVMLLGAIGNMEGSLARTGGPLFSVALVGGMLATLVGAWGALQLVNRWR
jgi:hypothetical protein